MNAPLTEGLAELPDQARAYLVQLRTRFFDVAAEPENDINPIPGHAALTWLRTELGERGFEVSEPKTEDWGWYVDVSAQAGRWLLGASGEEARDGAHDWTIQVVKRRSILQLLLGQERMTKSDPLFTVVSDLFRGSDVFESVCLDGSR